MPLQIVQLWRIMENLWSETSAFELKKTVQPLYDCGHLCPHTLVYFWSGAVFHGLDPFRFNWGKSKCNSMQWYFRQSVLPTFWYKSEEDSFLLQHDEALIHKAGARKNLTGLLRTLTSTPSNTLRIDLNANWEPGLIPHWLASLVLQIPAARFRNAAKGLPEEWGLSQQQINVNGFGMRCVLRVQRQHFISHNIILMISTFQSPKVYMSLTLEIVCFPVGWYVGSGYILLPQNLQKLRASMDKQCTNEEEEEEMDEESENSQLLRLMARHTQLKDLLHAHHVIGTHYKFYLPIYYVSDTERSALMPSSYIYIYFSDSSEMCLNPPSLPAMFFLLMSLGGYNIMKTRQGKAVCVSLATAYEGVFLETFNLEIDLKTMRIIRHNIPPYIPLNSLAEQSNLQTNLRTFLDTLSQHLNAFSGRKQQLKLVKVPGFAFFCVLVLNNVTEWVVCQPLWK